jgi:hypothetical protein
MKFGVPWIAFRFDTPWTVEPPPFTIFAFIPSWRIDGIKKNAP